MAKVSHNRIGRFPGIGGRHHSSAALRVARWATAAMLGAGLGMGPAACESTPPEAGDKAEAPMRGVEAAERSVQPAATGGAKDSAGRPPVLAQGRPLTWDELRPLLAEAGGAAAIEEALLDRLLADLYTRDGRTVTKDDLERERRMLIASVSNAASITDDQAAEAITRIRAGRGLGPARFQALLARNAMLRALVAPRVTMQPVDIEQGLKVRYGPRLRVRLITTATQQEAGAVLDAVKSAPAEQAERTFAELAFTKSTDQSKLRGGLLEPLSTADTSYAAGLRGALQNLSAGQVTPIVALDRGYAIAYVIGVDAGPAPPADARERVETEIRTRLERVEMEKLANELIERARPTIFDPGLDWSWRQRRQGP